MATFKVQIEDITGAVGDDAGLTQWLTDGAKEIINILPSKLKEKCASISIVNATNGTTLDMDSGGEILQVTRLSANSGGYYIPCRALHPMYGDLTNDSTSLYYATVTDPVYWITSNSSGVSTLFVKPTTTDSQPSNVYRIAYPSVAYGDSVIANFPNEGEYLVVLYAAIKGLHRLQNDLSSNSDITTALTAINTELDETQAVCDKIDADLVLAKAEVVLAKAEAAELATQTDNSGDIATALTAINTALDHFRGDSDPALFGDEQQYETGVGLSHVKDALDNARTIIDDGANSPTGNAAGDAATYLYTEEDVELLGGALGIAQSEISRAKAHIDEWNATVQALLGEVGGFAKEAEARVAFSGAKLQAVQGHISTAQSYIATAQGFGSEIQAKVNIAQGYIAEATTRMARETQKYQWYQAQQLKLQQDYDKGITMLVSQGIPKPAKQERAR